MTIYLMTQKIQALFDKLQNNYPKQQKDLKFIKHLSLYQQIILLLINLNFGVSIPID